MQTVAMEVTAGTRIVPYMVNVHTADEELLRRFCVTSLPVCVFLCNGWTFITLHVNEPALRATCAWVDGKIPRSK